MKTFSFLLVFFLSFSFAFSQLVTPNDRVSSRLNVRDLPSSAGNIIGSLEPGESAALLSETVPYYYQILFSGVDTAYVHKGYSKVVGHMKDSLVIGSWNIKFFGSPDSCKRDIETIADIVQTMDVMAIQEVSDKNFLERLDSLVELLGTRGYNYEYLYSDPSGYDDNPISGLNDYTERSGFIWDVDRISISHIDEGYKFIDAPIINNPVFRVVPISAEFEVKSPEGFDFQLISVHTVYKQEIAYVREREFSYLHDWMNEQIEDPDIIEKDIFMIGDFNSNPTYQPKRNHYFYDVVTDTTNYRIIFNEPVLAGQKSIRTTILVPIKNTEGEHELPVYDHLLLSRHTSYALPLDTLTWESGVIGVIDFDLDQKWQDMGDRKKVEWIVSDHRPIWIKLPYDTEDRDGQ